MEIEVINSIKTLAEPLINEVIKTFLEPKLKGLNEKWAKKNKIFNLDLKNTFKDYLNNAYEKNSIINTIALKRERVRLNDIYIPLRIKSLDDEESILIESFSDLLFDNSSKILITDTAGMGKSTLSKKLLISCVEENKGLPVLIELRRLSKTKSIVEEIIEQLNPINDVIDKQLILDLIKRGDFVFLLDGYDEIPLSERSHVTKEIQNFINKAGKNKFLLASRPEDALISFGDFEKYKIQPLKPDEAFTLLKKYDGNGGFSKLLIDKISVNENYINIKEYLTTPLLVSLLFTAFEYKQIIPFKKHVFYRQVFDALFESHDLSKGESFQREKCSGLGLDEFDRMLRALGYLCFLEDKIEFNKSDFQNIVKRSIETCGDVRCNVSSFIRDLTVTVPMFNKDGIYYKWSHKSLQEYFSAEFIYQDAKENQKRILEKMCFHANNKSFINIIDLYRSIDPKGFKIYVEHKLLSDYRRYLESTYINFSGAKKIARQEYTFGHDVFLVKFPLKSGDKDERLSNVINLVPKKLNGVMRNNISFMVYFASNGESISHIQALKMENPYQILIDFLYSKGCNYIIKRKSLSELERTKLKIAMRIAVKKVYEVNDDEDNILNKGGNFVKTNNLIRYFAMEEVGFIDLDKGNNYLKNIELIVNLNDNENFLLKF